MYRLVFVCLLLVGVSQAGQRRHYSKFQFENFFIFRISFLATGIANLVRDAFKRGLSRFIDRQTSYDSEVFRYTQQYQRGYGGLFAGESCRLSPMICSHDDQCCTGRCLCRQWTITGEERCIRKCF